MSELQISQIKTKLAHLAQRIIDSKNVRSINKNGGNKCSIKKPAELIGQLKYLSDKPSFRIEFRNIGL
ncbi:MAG: hypothetical protein KUG79_15090 [Pseudomonadales bacterium]|nr:hypothetical protein [Pseudomonadales bacterium]